MFKKRKVSNAPVTYKFFETIPDRGPLYLGVMSQVRTTADGVPWYRWESAFGANSGEGEDDVAINAIQVCAMKSEAVADIKLWGRYR